MTVFDDPELGIAPLEELRARTSPEIRSSRFSIGFECLDRQLFNPVPCYDRAAGLGVKWARCLSGWSRCEPERGVYRFEWLDEVVDSLLARGIRPWFSLTYGNPVYMPDAPHSSAVGCVPLGYGADCREAWRRYVRALGSHFRGRVQHFEIWNEPDLPDFWVPEEPSGKTYAELVELTVGALREAHPDAVALGTVSKLQGPFVRDALRSGAGRHLSHWCVHPYGIIPENGYEKRIRHLQGLFAEYAPHITIWQGECGYPHQACGHKDIPAMPMYRSDEEIQAKLVLRRMVIDSWLNLELSSYFHIADLLEKPYRSSSGAAQPPTLLGLLKTLQYEPKKSYYAYRNLAGILDAESTPAALELEVELPGYSLLHRGFLPLYGIRCATFLRNNYGLYIWHSVEDPQRQWFGEPVNLQVLDECPEKMTQPVLVDPLHGRVWRCTDTVRRDGMFFVNRLPLTDYPLILTDYGALKP